MRSSNRTPSPQAVVILDDHRSVRQQGLGVHARSGTGRKPAVDRSAPCLRPKGPLSAGKEALPFVVERNGSDLVRPDSNAICSRKIKGVPVRHVLARMIPAANWDGARLTRADANGVARSSAVRAKSGPRSRLVGSSRTLLARRHRVRPSASSARALARRGRSGPHCSRPSRP